MSVQLQALADEVFEAAAALDVVLPSGMRAVAAADPAEPGDASQTWIAMVQVFPQIPAGGGKGGAFIILPVDDEEQWVAFEGVIRAQSAEQGPADEMTAELITLYRWRAVNTPHRFYLAYDGDRAVAHVGLFQHRTSAYLHGLFTQPSARQRGAGSALTLAMSEEARAMGCERVVLQCARDSHLPAYFGRLGFRAVGEHQIWTKPE